MADKTKCFVTHIFSDTEAGFGIRADNDERVYIPPKVVQDMNLQALDEIEAVIVRNRKKSGSAVWVMLRGRIIETIEEV